MITRTVVFSIHPTQKQAEALIETVKLYSQACKHCVDVAVGKANAEKERRIQVASYNAETITGENEAKVKVANVNAQLFEQEADAARRGQIAQQYAYAEINKAKSLAELKRLEAEEVVPKEIEKQKIEIAAAASAAKQRIEAEGQAAAILKIKEAEAEGTRKVLEAKADGYKLLVQACSNNSKDASTMLMIEKLEEIAKLQADAIKNIKFDKITVWDNGSSTHGSSTSNFVSSMVKALPPLHEIAAMTGVKLPSYLGNLEKEKPEQTVKAAQKTTNPKQKTVKGIL